ncbi:Putative uncharacterized protein [Taphrina deformans PYCC 5710]|uniref:Uncharacterized protein n=1 Tax=Taphrina deformans (strain PYCC 5710 / ATCC 11124 / CBS 356.35 / IMI 108563 / JCM 9778 / NBRC 8474) TaxID=1097556 RepID=R4X7T9_TAPDE|nr:Putative uncharacterized protein [Taphrina deformans PYCC 5710]|eukprot:CCG81516.1 Putative uncharacterized protein [Taphrina deformans PYCC 5710]
MDPKSLRSRYLRAILAAVFGLACILCYVAGRPFGADEDESGIVTVQSLPELSLHVQHARSLPATEDYSKMLITGGLDSKAPSWISMLPKDMDATYFPVLDSSSNYVNKGHEAMFYLRYIVDNFDALPKYMVFVHDHKRAWHNSDSTDRSIVHLLSDVQWSFVEQEGFVNLRCQRKPNCPSILPLQGFVRAGKMETFFEEAWSDVFEEEFGPLGQIAATCCAQFAVTRDAVHLRSLEFYQNLIHWLEDSDGTDWQLGRVLEYTWHIIFGKSLINCPDADVCRSNLYGYHPELF